MTTKYRKSQCPTCGADIIWAFLRKKDGSTGKIPLNYTRTRPYSLDGNLNNPTASDGELVYISHFLTCPAVPKRRV
jgi:hypothetical protein